MTTTAAWRYQHVMYFGHVLGYESPRRFAKLPRDWIDAVGCTSDVDRGLNFTALTASSSHALLSYTLLPHPLDPTTTSRRPATLHPTVLDAQAPCHDHREVQGEVIDVGGRTSGSAQPSKVLALGRNTHAQLGLGFASHEATRGMVTGELHGKGGVSALAAGTGFSFVVTANADQTSTLYAFGNDTLGQLGTARPEEQPTPPHADAYDLSYRAVGSDAAQLRLLPLPRKVQFETDSEGEREEGSSGWRVKSIAVGVDHSLVLRERVLGGYRLQGVLSTGLNTDGQLGTTPSQSADAVPIQPLLSRTFQPVPGLPDAPIPVDSGEGQGGMGVVVCGADTSYVVLDSGDLWVWGNSEYGQSFAGIRDRIPHPTFVSNPLIAAYEAQGLGRDEGEPRIRTLVAGGSFAAILDSNGRVWTIGYGARANDAPDDTLAQVEGLPQDEEVTGIFAGLEYVVATTQGGTQGGDSKQLNVWMWGVPPRSVSSRPLTRPTRVPLAIAKSPYQQYLDENARLKSQQPDEQGARVVDVVGAACTREHVILVLDDHCHPHVWAECHQPPRSKGSDLTR